MKLPGKQEKQGLGYSCRNTKGDTLEDFKTFHYYKYVSSRIKKLVLLSAASEITVAVERVTIMGYRWKLMKLR